MSSICSNVQIEPEIKIIDLHLTLKSQKTNWGIIVKN